MKSASGEPVVSNTELTEMTLDADNAFKGVVPTTSADPEFVKSASAVGFPVAAAMANGGRTSGLQSTLGRLGDVLNKLGADPDIVKEITLSGIGNWTTTDGPWLYDLESPSKKVFPVLTPLRNRIPRTKGIGTSHRFRRIDGITGSQTGGIANLDISMAESVSTSFRGVTLNRPQKVSYATSIANVPYKLQGLSDDLTWAAQYAGVGFEDLRGLINHNLLLAHMMGEEQLILSGRITAVAAPTLVAANVTQRPAGSGANGYSNEAAITGITTQIYIKVAAITHFGYSATSAAQTVVVSAGNVVDVTLATLPTGAHGYAVFVSTGASDPGDGSRFLALWNSGPAFGLGYTGGNVFTLSGALPTTGTTSPASDSTANANAYDGLMTQTIANGLVVPKLNGALTLDAITKNVFLPGWLQFKADYDELWVHALESIKITDLVLGASGTPYRITVPVGSEGGVTGNYRVDRLVNKVTGKTVSVTPHPYLEQGNVLALSYSLPFPYSEVPNTWSMVLPQDYMSIQWPVIQMSYDASTFTFGALVGYAPAYSAVLQGVQPS
jgi:hypothetical protein